MSDSTITRWSVSNSSSTKAGEPHWADELGHTPTAEEILTFARMLEEQYYLEGTLFYRSGDLVDWDALLKLLEEGQ